MAHQSPQGFAGRQGLQHGTSRRRRLFPFGGIGIQQDAGSVGGAPQGGPGGGSQRCAVAQIEHEVGVVARRGRTHLEPGIVGGQLGGLAGVQQATETGRGQVGGTEWRLSVQQDTGLADPFLTLAAHLGQKDLARVAGDAIGLEGQSWISSSVSSTCTPFSRR